ncbi:MAG: hypothetical protein ACJ77Y_04870, partial [Chloroflexota bacterium]
MVFDIGEKKQRPTGLGGMHRYVIGCQGSAFLEALCGRSERHPQQFIEDHRVEETCDLRGVLEDRPEILRLGIEIVLIEVAPDERLKSVECDASHLVGLTRLALTTDETNCPAIVERLILGNG